MGHESATEKVGAKNSRLTDRLKDWEQSHFSQNLRLAIGIT